MRLYFYDTSELENEDRYDACYACMDEARRAKIDAYASRKDRERSLGAGLLLEQALEEAGIPAGERELALNEHGKPYLKQHPELHFSLSHSGSRIMCITADREVGCDVERVIPENGTHADSRLRVARRFFTDTEYELLMSQPTSMDRQIMFTRLWTLKESFLKVTGMGMALPLRAFELSLGTDGQVALVNCSVPGEYEFCEVDRRDDYRYSYCIKIK